ncbi:MAG: prephenate dehydrogenase [Rhodothermia bacterium]|nr:MAG: prephenate dehydrogenase [Rhodothermia bacterium]
MINRICIVGVGLMGGSFGLSVRRTRPDLIVIGVDSEDVLQKALERGAITEAAKSLSEAVASADLIMLCTPVLESISLMDEIGRSARKNTIVSDVCSVKMPLQTAAENSLGAKVAFIGGHPMTGSESSGINHADEFLYENATYVLCPPSRMDEDLFAERYSDLIAVIRSTGGRILLMDAQKHDRIAARISHLPQLVAIALVNSVGAKRDTDPELLQLAAGGFRDMTRIASSTYDIWREILQSNSDPILEALEGLSDEIDNLRTLLSSNDYQAIEERFQSAEDIRTSIPPRSKGFIQPLADVFVFVSDQPGAISDMTGRLTDDQLNIKDIELLKIREGTGGTFRIGLETEAAAERALIVLTDAGYRVHRL